MLNPIRKTWDSLNEVAAALSRLASALNGVSNVVEHEIGRYETPDPAELPNGTPARKRVGAK